MSTISAVIAEVVAEYTGEVFALMGNGNAYFTDAVSRDPRITVTTVRHESATVASADAYWRISRKIAVATTTYGPGYTNALTPLADAALSHSALVFVVGSEPSTGPRPWDIDQQATAEALGAACCIVDPQHPRRSCHEAFALALTQQRPVVLLIPYDYAAAPAPHEKELPSAAALTEQLQTQRAATVEGAACQEQLTEFAELLAHAQRPLILAGRGALSAREELIGIARHLGALTVATAPARGIFAAEPYDLGVCGGFASEPSAELIRQADVVLAVGASLNQFTLAFGTAFDAEAHLIQVDQRADAAVARTNSFLQADAQAACTQLQQRLQQRGPAASSVWNGLVPHAASSELSYQRDAGVGQCADGRLDPRTVMRFLDEILPEERQVICDGGHFIGWANYYWKLPAMDSMLLVGTHFQSIGLGFPSAPGAVRARPDARPIVVTGDGGGVMGIADLDSLIRCAPQAVVVVLNDACYGAEIHQYGARGLDETVMNIAQLDFATIAAGMGATGVQVNTLEQLHQLPEILAETSGSLLLDIRISRSVVAPYLQEIISHTLGGQD